ncbi:MAG: non-ribosomal peptide synthetase, partial [Gemmatimonadetes bacterium]|nr:non-ribosomal peptide synthetase [Gemmatimonadota bacterium]
MTAPDVEDIYELSPLQQGILLHSVASPTASFYFVQSCYALQGELDAPAFCRAWEAAVRRHEVLRTSFYWEKLEKPLQVVRRQAELPCDVQEWRGLGAAEREARLEAYLREDRARGFDLTRAPLMRLALFRVEDEAHWLVLSSHHLLLDGWSKAVLLRDVASTYAALRRGEAPAPSPGRPFRDYILWLQKQDLGAAERYWRRTLRGFTAPTPVGAAPLPGGEPRPDDFGEEVLSLSAEDTGALRGFSRRHLLTVNSVVQGVWALLLSRYSGEEDVVFGATVSGRPTALPGVESMVGMFINTLPVRARLEADQPVAAWLRRLQAEQAAARQYEFTPLFRLQRWSEVPPGAALFESLLVFENYPAAAAGAGSGGNALRLRSFRSVERANYPLSILVSPGIALHFRVIYDRRRLEAATIRRMLGHLRTLLAEIVRDPERPVSAL